MNKNPLVTLTIASGYTKNVIGAIKLELNPEKAPVTVKNFLKCVESGHYDKSLFHRVIPGFMIQGGGYKEEMKPCPEVPMIENEANNGLKNEQYTLAMARTSAPHSATSQFFINVAKNSFLDHTSKSQSGWGYTVFGKVIGGQSVVDSISQVKTKRHGFHDDVPEINIIIVSAVVVQDSE